MTDSELRPQRVAQMKGSGNRIDADVVLGSTRVKITVTASDDDIADEITALHTKLIARARGDLSTQLEMDLSPSTRKALKA